MNILAHLNTQTLEDINGMVLRKIFNCMKKLKFVFLLLFCILQGLFPQSKPPFQLGEVLHYDASINLIIAGKAKLEVSSIDTILGFPAYHIIFSVKSNPLLDRLYKVRDKVETWIDLEHHFTRKFKKKIREGGFRKEFSAIVNYEDSLITTTDMEFPLTSTVRDPYSLFYYLRTIPLTVGNIYPFTTFDDNKFTDIKFTVRYKKNVRVPAGLYNCLVVKPFRESGSLFKSKGNMTIWFSDDEHRLPVKIILKTKFGSMVLKLKEIKF